MSYARTGGAHGPNLLRPFGWPAKAMLDAHLDARYDTGPY